MRNEAEGPLVRGSECKDLGQRGRTSISSSHRLCETSASVQFVFASLHLRSTSLFGMYPSSGAWVSMQRCLYFHSVFVRLRFSFAVIFAQLRLRLDFVSGRHWLCSSFCSHYFVFDRLRPYVKLRLRSTSSIRETPSPL